MKMTVRELAAACGGTLLAGDPEAAVTSASTDSREIEPGALFVPVAGEKTDGHAFIAKAFAAGAAATLTQKGRLTRVGGAWIAVDDTRLALQKIAAAWRKRFSGPVVGVTGSVGKTTTKELTALALSAGKRVLRTEGNRNSQVGLPLTVLRLSPEYDAAVVEMGMSEFGEMARIAAVAAPDFAVLTNIGLSHIGQLKTRENILREKLHIADRFHEGSALFLNGDDPMLAALRGKLPFETVYYGTKPWCDFRADGLRAEGETAEFRWTAPDGETGEARLAVPGVHSVLDALAALAAAQRLGVPPAKAAAALAKYRPIAMRLQVRRTEGGVTVIDDSYNSSPDAAKSSLDVLCGFSGGKRVAVLADMLELGDFSRRAHEEVGRHAARAGVDALVTVGNEARAVAGGALAERPSLPCRICRSNAEALAELRRILAAGDTVLVKGSRGMRTDEIVAGLLRRG